MQSCTCSKTVLAWPGSLSISRILLAGCLVLLSQFARVEAAPLSAFPCTLAWNQCQDSTVSGYCLYYGIKGSTTTNRLDVGKTGLVTLKNLLTSSNYFFYVTAYDSIGTEGPPSSVMCYTAQALSALKLTRLANRTMNLHFLAAPGTVCLVIYSPTASVAIPGRRDRGRKWKRDGNRSVVRQYACPILPERPPLPTRPALTGTARPFVMPAPIRF